MSWRGVVKESGVESQAENETPDVPAPSLPGHYALKFDLVCEGIDWFERCGSETTTKEFWALGLNRR